MHNFYVRTAIIGYTSGDLGSDSPDVCNCAHIG